MEKGVKQIRTYYLLFFRFGVCDNALPAADFEVLAVRPSRRVLEAAEAAFVLVCLAGALRWDIALPAADFEALPVDWLVSVFDALLAAGLLVTFRFFAMVLFLLFRLRCPDEPEPFRFVGGN